MPLDIDALWDYADPAGTEARFRAALPACEAAADPAVADERLDEWLQLLTQIARAQCLRRQYADVHATLDRVDAVLARHDASALGVPKVRALLERGRCHNDSREPAEAEARFLAAWDLARERGLDFYAVDAAHMLGIVAQPKEAALAWNERAVEYARTSPDPKARRWLATLANNIGWTYHDMGRYADALAVFEEALRLRVEQGKPGPIRIARWSVAKIQRLLGRVDDALATQRALLAECESTGQPDGYTHEELAECLLATGAADEARPHFARAYEVLSKDPWFPPTQPERLERLRRLGEGHGS